MATPVFEVWMLIDSNGDYSVGTDQDTADQAYEDSIQERSEADGIRYVKISVTVPLPEPTIKIEVAVPETEGAPTVRVT